MKNNIKPFPLRIPISLYEQLEAVSAKNGRSVNHEILHRLEESLPLGAQRNVAAMQRERQKAELALTFEVWQQDVRWPHDERNAIREYCRRYKAADLAQEEGEVERVAGFDEVEPWHLSGILLAFRWYASQSVHVQKFIDPLRPQKLAPEHSKRKLVLAYLHWCSTTSSQPMAEESVMTFCDRYNNSEENLIFDIQEIAAGYLYDLLNEWFCNFPVMAAEISRIAEFKRELLKEMHEEQLKKLQGIEDEINKTNEYTTKK
ncbi:Arc family DNA-binding protein [Vogesella sp. LYT5W]|uniref:Arc family DNA-binding protein n=1 Tax=Vogesella margarita TaxID=2984199 RepID=A0ABT5IPC0_9NEIS|nr:Arc family DNA-binding protein [Vogesella margarita]MDC7714416.1 Arc family DNA-binding protein [Vogesella margarita]